MKKVSLIIIATLIIGTAFAFETNRKTEEHINNKAPIEIKTNENLSSPRMCCRRTASNEEGESWTATRCYTHADGAIAKGRACALAQSDANKAQLQAAEYIFTDNSGN